MTLVLAHSVRLRILSTGHSSLVPRLQRIPTSQSPTTLKWVHHNSVLRCCALPVDNNGGPLEAESGDGAPGNLHPLPGESQVLHAGTTVVANNSSSESKGEEHGGSQTAAAGAEPWIALTESRIEKTIFDFRFLTLMAIGGSLSGSLLCFLKGCGFVYDSYIAYFAIYSTGVHTGKVILRLVEAVEIYLVGTVMLIFAMGLFGLFISNESQNKTDNDRALKNTTLFGMFVLTKRPAWMQITSLDTLKTKLGHCIVMILVVKLFEKSKTVCIASSVDLLMYSIAIFLASGSLYVLQQLHHASRFTST